MLNEIKLDKESLLREKELMIDVTHQINDKLLSEGTKQSPLNENNYIFPFQRRARSLSPPKDNLGDNS